MSRSKSLWIEITKFGIKDLEYWESLEMLGNLIERFYWYVCEGTRSNNRGLLTLIKWS